MWNVDILYLISEVAFNAILFQRGVFHAKDFKLRNFYELDIFMLNNENRKGKYIKELLHSLKGNAKVLCCFHLMYDSAIVFSFSLYFYIDGIAQGFVEKIYLDLRAIGTKEIQERWNFKIIHRKGFKAVGHKIQLTRKQLKIVKLEIGDVLRQILASVSILPRLHDKVYAAYAFTYSGSLPLPEHKWRSIIDTSYNIQNYQTLRFRTFETDWHRVKTTVHYKPSFGFSYH